MSRHRATGPAAQRGRSRLRSQLTALAVVPAVCAALLAVAAIAVVTASGRSQPLRGTTLVAVSVLGCLTVLVVVAGFVWARQVARSARRTAVEVIRVPTPAPALAPVSAPAPVPVPRPAPAVPPAMSPAAPAAPQQSPATILATQVPAPAAAPAPAQSPTQAPAPATDRGVFVHLSHRLQSLVHRQIQLLDALENDVEEPDLLKGLFGVDHIATRMRRHAENLAVLGGAVPRRQWTKPVSVMEILRSAVSETIDYARVQVIARMPGSLNGYAVADVIHLLAELVENATTFSPPDTKVVLRTQAVAAGLVIEIDDRGLGLPQPEYDRLNALLREPAEVNVRELLEGARIGLYVVAQLARRHGIAIRLQTNITGGTQALVVLPKALLATESREYDQPIQSIREISPGAPAPASPPPPPVAPAPPAPPARPAAPTPLPPPAISIPAQAAPHRPVATIPAPGAANTVTALTDTAPSAGPLYVGDGVLPGPRQPMNAPPPVGAPVLQPQPQHRPQSQPQPRRPPTPLGPYEPATPRASLPLNIPPETHLDTSSTIPMGDLRPPAYDPEAVPAPPARPRVAPGAPGAPATAAPRQIFSQPDPASRPPLPRRRPQEHLATPLAQAAGPGAGAGTPADRVGEGLSPTLMADFRRGLSLGAAEPGSDPHHPHEHHAPTQEGER